MAEKKDKFVDALAGPYSYDLGMDAYGHPTNGAGRCSFLNENGGNGPCPPTITRQTTFMLAMPLDRVITVAYQWGVSVPVGATVAILVPLINLVIY